MSKSANLRDQGLLLTHPTMPGHSIVRIDVVVNDVLIDEYEALERAAKGRGWDGQGDVADAVRYLIEWPKIVAANDVMAQLEREVKEQAVGALRQQIAGLF